MQLPISGKAKDSIQIAVFLLLYNVDNGVCNGEESERDSQVFYDLVLETLVVLLRDFLRDLQKAATGLRSRAQRSGVILKLEEVSKRGAEVFLFLYGVNGYRCAERHKVRD